MPDDVPWLDDAEADAWLDLAAVGQLLPAALDTQLEHDADLNFFEYLTLVQLADAPDRSLRMSDLAAHTHATLARLSRVVSRLEAQGLVERQADESDRRARRAHLTDAGVARLDEAAPGHVATVRRLFTDVLSPEEAQTLSALCRRLLEVLDPERTVLAPTLDSHHRPGLSSRPADLDAS